MTGKNGDNAGKGLALAGLIVGLATGGAVYGLVEYWLDRSVSAPAPYATLLFVVTVAASFLLLAERGRPGRAIIAAGAIAAFLILPDYFMAGAAGDESKNLSSFPPMLWFSVSRCLVVYLLVVLVKASLEDGAPPPYARVFFHGLTLPLIIAGAALFAGLALLLLFAWARLLQEMDVELFDTLFRKPWFISPFLGAIGGLSITMMRAQQSILGALRFILLLLARIVTPITALFTITFLAVLAAKGTGAIFDKPYPAGLMIGLALVGMLIFNGVYQNGEGGPPPLWLRLSTLITLAGLPFYTGIAFYALMLRVGEYGLTPPRIGGLTVAALVAAYSIVCVAGVISELHWRAKRWMALAAPLNTAMAAVWIIALTMFATPLVNPWALSAQSQYERLANGRAAAEDFDFGYLRFELGKHGEDALDRLIALSAHPERDAIRDGVERARAAKSYWEYKNPGVVPAEPETVEERTDGPMELEFNPSGADTGADDPDLSESEDR